MQKQVVALGFDEEPDEVQRIFLEDIGLLDIQPAVIEPEGGRRGKLRP